MTSRATINMHKGGFILSSPSSALTRFHTPLKGVWKRSAAYLFILFTPASARVNAREKAYSSAQDATKFNGAELSRFTPANASNSTNHVPVSRIEFAAHRSCNYVRELALVNQLVASEFRCYPLPSNMDIGSEYINRQLNKARWRYSKFTHTKYGS